MAAIKDNAMMVEITRITKRAELADEHVQISYYCGDFKVAHELYDSKGNVVQASGSIPDGTVKEYYGDGILKEALLFQDGKANGRSILYYPDGKIFEMKNYTNGLLHGWSRTYRRDGTLWMQSSFFEGKLHGRFTSYHNNGIAEIKAEYWNGRLNGHSLIYDRAGNLRKEEYSSWGSETANIYHTTHQVNSRGARHTGADGSFPVRSTRRTACLLQHGIMVTTGGHAIAMGKIHITRHDLERFQSVVDIQNGPEAPFIEKPKKELYRATILEPTNVPGDVVTMNSIVRVRNINTAGERAFLLAFPVKTGSQGRAVSILSPMGIALPGYRERDVLEWEWHLSSGRVEIRVMEIIYQPERLGNNKL